MNLIGGIKNRKLAYLEQGCERYAIMAYEVLRRELAMGFKSVKYSYTGDEDGRTGLFTATFIPWEQSMEDKHGHRSTEVTFHIEATEGSWRLSHGAMKDLGTGMAATIRFTHGAFRRIVLNIPEWDEIRYASNADHTKKDHVFEISAGQKPWGDFYNEVVI